ncbi:MAG: DUF6966 domain-containing protein [Burkholderiales bacterium]
MNTHATYRTLLRQIADHLADFGDRRWPAVIAGWLAEIGGEGEEIPATHLQRTRRALGGMGSIGDVVICPEAGHLISSDKKEIRKANERLLHLVHELDEEVDKMLSLRPKAKIEERANRS